MVDDTDYRILNMQLANLQSELSDAHTAYIDAKSRGDWRLAGDLQETVLGFQNRIDVINNTMGSYSQPQAQQDIRALPRVQQDRISEQYLTEAAMRAGLPSSGLLEAARVCGVSPSEYLEGMAKQQEAGDASKGQKI